jgi:hypothetical protein
MSAADSGGGGGVNWVSLLQALAPAPAPDPAAAPAEQRYGTLYPEGPITPLWLPVVLLAHAFAAYWLLQMLLLWNPSLGHRLRGRLAGRRGRRQEGGTGAAAAEAAPPAGAPLRCSGCCC